MTRHFLWAALAVALGASALGYQNRVAAQNSGATPAEESASTDQTGTGAPAGATAGQEQSGTTSSGQAESAQTTNKGDSSQAGNQPASGTASDSQPSSVATGSNASDANRSQNTNSNQSSQNSATVQNPNDPNAGTSPQHPRTDNNQQSVQPDNVNANRNQTDNSVEGRARLDASTQHRNQTTLQRGLQFGQSTNRGLAIRDVDQSSIYFRSGFRRGDVIISLYGRPVRSQADFMRFIVMQPGRPIPVVLFRNGRQQTIYVEYPQEVVQTQPIYDNRAPQGSGAYLGVMFDVQARDAAVVLSVNPGSPAEKAGIQPRDLILAMNGQEIRSYPEVISVIRRMQPGQEIDIIVGRGQSEAQLSAVLAASANLRTATRQAEVNVYQQQVPSDQGADVQIDVNGRNNNGRIIDRNRNNSGNPDRPLLPRLRN